ncbi:MAG: HNH endonuclease signature motif containing protein [Kofleriaceae bacterium]
MLANDRCAIDAREAPLLRTVVRMDVWRHVAKVSLYAYLEDVLGYGPKVARDRVRVAFALEELPELAAALENGEHSYTAVRELTRVVTPPKEREWLDAVRGCNSARVQEMVSMHRRGDSPRDPIDTEAKPRIVTFELSPATYARFRQVQDEIANELGGEIDDNILFDALLSRGGDCEGTSARAQIQMTVCETCSQAFVNAGGHSLPISDAERDRLECDAVRIGSDREPARLTKDITPKTRRAVWQRDHEKCVVAGCRSTRHIDIHHIIPRAAGGSHRPDNLVLLCGGHHRLHHEGRLLFTRVAQSSGHQATVRLTDVQPRAGLVGKTDVANTNVPRGKTSGGHLEARHVARPTTAKPIVDAVVKNIAQPRVGLATSNYARVVMQTDAVKALVQLDFNRHEARSMVQRALAIIPDDADLPRFVAAALRFAVIPGVVIPARR